MRRGKDAIADLFRDQLLTLSSSSFFSLDSVDGLYQNGICPRCRSPVGQRTDRPLSIRSIWPGDLSYSSDQRMRARVWVVSDRFLELLTRRERAQFDIRQVTMPLGTRKAFFEVLPRRFVPQAGVKNWSVSAGWYCGRCQARAFSYDEQLGDILRTIVCRSSLLPAKPLLFVGDAGSFKIAVARDRWDEWRRVPVGKQIRGIPLAVIDSSLYAQVDLPEYEVVAERNRKRARRARR